MKLGLAGRAAGFLEQDVFLSGDGVKTRRQQTSGILHEALRNYGQWENEADGAVVWLASRSLWRRLIA